jgi:hypothetical protein
MSHIEISIYNDRESTNALCKYLIYSFDNNSPISYYLQIFKLTDNLNILDNEINFDLTDMGMISFDSFDSLISFLTLSLEEFDYIIYKYISLYLKSNSVYKKRLRTSGYLLEFEIKELFDIFSHMNIQKRKKDFQQFLLNNFTSPILPNEILCKISSFI